MPIYEYYCSDCNSKFELLRPKSKADDLSICKRCQGTHTSRAISVFAAHSGGKALAGSGGGCAGCAPSSACVSCRSH
jgi:putative FmdB family regulatory protein